MKKIAISFFAVLFLAGVACGGKASGSDSKDALKTQCQGRAVTFNDRATTLESRAGSINPLDESDVRLFLSDARSLLSDGRSIASDCDSLLTSAEASELAGLLDQFEDAINKAAALYN